MDIPKQMGIAEWEFRVVVGRTTIEYDETKEQENRSKHGYSLESATHLLERLLFSLGNKPPHIVSDAFMENGEVRHMHMGVDDCGDVILMVTTMRSDEKVRVISFRRAADGERENFKKLTGYVKSTS